MCCGACHSVTHPIRLQSAILCLSDKPDARRTHRCSPHLVALSRSLWSGAGKASCFLSLLVWMEGKAPRGPASLAGRVLRCPPQVWLGRRVSCSLLMVFWEGWPLAVSCRSSGKWSLAVPPSLLGRRAPCWLIPVFREGGPLAVSCFFRMVSRSPRRCDWKRESLFLLLVFWEGGPRAVSCWSLWKEAPSRSILIWTGRIPRDPRHAACVFTVDAREEEFLVSVLSGTYVPRNEYQGRHPLRAGVGGLFAGPAQSRPVTVAPAVYYSRC